MQKHYSIEVPTLCYNVQMRVTTNKTLAIEPLIDETLQGLSCQYALYYRPRGGTGILRKNCDLFLSASIIKVPILYAWAYLEQEGFVSQNEMCDLDAETQVEGAGFARLYQQRALPYHDVLLMMMAVSDNLCTNLIIRRIGLPRLNDLFRRLGLPHARVERRLMDYEARARGLDNWISPEDCIHLYDIRDRLPQGARTWTDKMLECNVDLGLWLRNIRRDSVELLHKTGDMTGVLHDWGYTKDADLFLLTQDVGNDAEVFRLLDHLGPILLALR